MNYTKRIENIKGDIKLQRYQKIPYNIIQTFKTRDVPITMWDNVYKWHLLNPEYNYLFFDDNDIYKYINDCNFNKLNISKNDFKKALLKVKPGAGKADLFRLLIVYNIGGCYFDIDTTPLFPLKKFVNSNDEVVSGIGYRGDFHQWGLIYIKEHPFIKKALEIAVQNVINETFIDNIKMLPYLCGPPVLDIAIKSVLNYKKDYKFLPGIFKINSISFTLLKGDFFNNNVKFKYSNYKNDLKIMNHTYWQSEKIFND
tara:strand:+ start:13198 stop:13965 length:768 start_codon:yes stop_codon:yes gene_type:complete